MEPQSIMAGQTHRNLAQLLLTTAERTPGSVALLLNQSRLTYGELNARVHAAAAGFLASGITRGDRVALMLPSTPTYVIAFYALMRLGAVAVNVSPGSQGSELLHVLTDSGAVAVVSLDLFLPALYKVLDRTQVRHLFITSVQGLEHKLPAPARASPRAFEELMRTGQGAPAELGASDDDLAVLQYTSGSTGTPKGVMLSHRNILASVAAMRGWIQHEEPENAAVICVIPFFHVFGLTIGLNLSVHKGYQMILVPRFDAFQLMPLVQLIEQHRPLSLPAVPTLWAALLSHPAVTAATLASIRVPSSGGAPLPGWVQDRYRALTGRTLYEAYGLSEATGATHCSPFPDGGPQGSIGKPLPGVSVRLVSSGGTGEEVAVGEIGELVIGGQTVMRGYFRNEALTRDALRDGWLYTGDLARRDAEGFFYIVDRKDDLIITSGYNVYPTEVEAVLAAHPAVQEAAVVGKPDRLRGAAVTAYVVPKDGAVVSSDDLLRLCRDNLADYKVPRTLEFRGPLPRNHAGKLLRKALREEAEAPIA